MKPLWKSLRFAFAVASGPAVPSSMRSASDRKLELISSISGSNSRRGACAVVAMLAIGADTTAATVAGAGCSGALGRTGAGSLKPRSDWLSIVDAVSVLRRVVSMAAS